MQYRQFGRLDWKVSALGFGCMRLPVLEGKSANIDEPEATRMIHYAIDHGVNYLDTAYPYHGGNSELFLGRALKGGYRQKVRLATKLPSWLIQSAEDFDRYLNEQLMKLQTAHVDFYLLHGLNKERWPRLRDLGVREWAQKAIADGRIGAIGFSFHDSYEVFKTIVDEFDWTFCQIQYNYMDIENQAGTKGLRYAAAKGLAVVVMEPLLGGKLVDPPEPIQQIWEAAPRRRTPADWGLQWVWNHPEVSLALSGMSTMAQVEENIVSASLSGVNHLTASELALFDLARQKYRELCPIPCTKCGYCLPCPNGVDIPGNFEAYNQGRMYNKPAAARRQYTWMLELAQRSNPAADPRAASCLQCGECEEKCPQHIPISQWMPIVHAVLGEGKPYEAVGAPQ